MATTLYAWNQAVTAGVTLAADQGAWDDVAAAVSKLMGETAVDGGTQTTVARAETNAGADYDVLLARFVSAPLSGAQTIAGTLDVVLGILESNAAADMHYHLHAYVVNPADGSVRGTLLTDYTEAAGVNEWPTTATGKALNAAQSLTSVDAQSGDRIVVEVGYVARNAVATSYTGTLYYGGNTGTALTAGSTSVTTQIGSLTFSQTLTFTQTARLTQLVTEVVVAPDSSLVDARLTQLATEVVIADWKVLSRDTFDRANSAVTLGSADTGEAWTAAAGTWGIASNLAYILCAAQQVTIWCDVKGTLNSGVNYRVPCLMFRMRPGGTTRYLYVRLLNGACELRSRNVGSHTTLATAAQTTLDDTDYRVEVYLNGAVVRVRVDGTQVISHTLSAANRNLYPGNSAYAGLTLSKGGAPATAARWNNFNVELGDPSGRSQTIVIV